MLCSAISGPYAFVEAREGVNQLFLRDYLHATDLGQDRLGPVHLIACHRSATEGQAVRQLGFPDATVVSTPFGVYVADKLQEMQRCSWRFCRTAEIRHRRGTRFSAYSIGSRKLEKGG